MDAKDFDICLPIAKKDKSFLREVAETGGEDCSTKYHVEKEFKGYSLLDVSVIGKIPHQIRVHLAYFDHPIVGDKLYNKVEHPTNLLLFCYKTDFIHPVTEKQVTINLELPKDFTDFISTPK
jgi:23S rRNA pseudouridine1911/1915/1917 synthase